MTSFNREKAAPLAIAVSASVLAAVTAAAFLVGSSSVSLGDLVAWATGGDVSASAKSILVNVRLPRVLAALLAGGALAVAGAAFLGLREKPIARYGMVASAAFLACLFCKDLPGLAVAALFVATATLSTRWVLASPRSNGRFAVAFALILLPLLSAKAGAVFDQNLLGFMGVSYITFKALQVLFEVRDGVIEELGLFDYLYFLLFFPVFTSGPIDRSRRFAEEARRVRSCEEYAGLLARGILLLLVGLVYTFVIAVWLHRFYAPTAWGTGPFLAELGVQVRTA